MTQLKVGLIGGGGIAGAHIRGYREHAAKIGITAVADAVEQTAADRGRELGATAYTDYASMLETEELDAVDICLPHHLHKDAIVAAAEAGKHILCEKPLCLSVEEAAQVRAAVSANGVTLMCAHNQLFMPAVAKAKELLDAGLLGTVYEVRTTDSFYNDFDPANMGWRASSKTSGGGELIDTGYHPTYLMLHLAGALPVEATAMLSTHRLKFMEGEDSAQVLIRFDNGVVGQLVTSWAYEPAPGTERFSVVGELGSLRSDGNSLTTLLRSGDTETYELEPVDTFAAEIGHFADSCSARPAPSTRRRRASPYWESCWPPTKGPGRTPSHRSDDRDGRDTESDPDKIGAQGADIAEWTVRGQGFGLEHADGVCGPYCESRDGQRLDPPTTGQRRADEDQHDQRRDVLRCVAVRANGDQQPVAGVGRGLVAAVLATDDPVAGDVGAEQEQQHAHQGDTDDRDGTHLRTPSY